MSRSHPERPDSAALDLWLTAGVILRHEPDEEEDEEEDEDDRKKDDEEEDDTDDGWSE